MTTRVVLLIHASEWARVGNTGHLARLAIAGADVRVHGLQRRNLACDRSDAISTLALFPGRGAAPLTAELVAALPRPITLLVPDGNWTQTKHMMARLPILRQARPIRLTAPRLDLCNVRHNDELDRRSTFEALAQALALLEGPEVERRLLDFFRRVLSRRNTYGVRQPIL
jgi:DTW domain-containing protein YfiP